MYVLKLLCLDNQIAVSLSMMLVLDCGSHVLLHMQHVHIHIYI